MSSLSPRLHAVVDALPLVEGMRVLEIGCGPDVAAREVARRLRRGHVLAIDRSAKAVSQAEAACTDEIASGRLSLRRVAAEDFALDMTSPSLSASGRSTAAIRRRESGRWRASPRR